MGLLLSIQAKATHVVGGEITWESLGNHKYRILANIYRDCNGVALSNSNIQFDNTLLQAGTQTMSFGRDITPACPTAGSRCDSSSSSFQYGIELYTLSVVIDVSQMIQANDCELMISWSQCCRNEAITTGGAKQNFMLQSQMNICQTPQSNGPKFRQDPVNIICLGRDFIGDFGAENTDRYGNGNPRDSFFYEFTNPMQSASQPTSWSSPYTPEKFISYLGFPKDYTIDRFPFGMHLGKRTGIIAFRPMKLEQTVLGLKVYEVRNNDTIGWVKRDQQIVVIKCPNNIPPTLTVKHDNQTIPLFKDNVIAVCPGQTLCLDIASDDRDNGDSTTISVLHNMPGATLVKGKKGAFDTAAFCWKPKGNLNSQRPYILTIRVKDNACPVNAFVDRIVYVYVKKPKLDLGPNINTCAYGQSIQITPSLPGGSWNTNAITTTDGIHYTLKADSQLAGLRSYVYTIGKTGNCSVSDTLSVNLKNPTKVSINLPDEACGSIGQKLYVEANPSGGYWLNDKPQQDSLGDYFIVDSAMQAEPTMFIYTYTNAMGCHDTAYHNISVFDKPSVNAGVDDTLCVIPNQRYYLNGTPAGGTWSGLVKQDAITNEYYADLGMSNIGNTPYEFVYTYTVNNSCQNSDTMSLIVRQGHEPSFTVSDTFGAAPLSVQFVNTSTGNAQNTWHFGNGDTSTQNPATYIYRNDGYYKAKLVLANLDGSCETEAETAIRVGPVANVHDILEDEQITLYPNPTQDMLTIHNPQDEMQIYVYDAMGKMVKTASLIKGDNKLVLSELSDGVYHYKTSHYQNGRFVIMR